MNEPHAHPFWKFSGSLAGLLALLALLAAANLLLSRVRLRADFTEEKLYTLSPGTRAILRSLDSPVTLKFFFSDSAPEVPVPIKQFARQVADLLEEYALASGGKVRVETYDPQPDSDAEEWAERYGLVGEPLGPMEPSLYMGLVAVKGDTQAALPFLDPRNDQLLEYQVSQMLARVANPAKPVIGVLSALPVMGVRSFPYAMPGQPPPKNQPAWVAFEDLGKDYTVREVPADADAIDDDIQVLVVVHPKTISEATQYALDQFVLRGGRLLAFVDPMCLADALTQPPPMGMGMPPRPASDLGRLPAAWGLEFSSDQVVADLTASTPIRRGDTDTEDSPVFLTLRDLNIDRRDLATATLRMLSLPGAGSFTGSGAEGLTVTPLLVSSENSQLVDGMLAQMSADGIRRSFQSGLKRLPLAVRVQGQFRTAFPEGKPKKPAEPKPGEPAPEPAAEDTGTEPGLTNSVSPGLVVLVGDADLLYDAFAVQELPPIFGQRVYQPRNDNLTLFATLIEQLSGSPALADIRARGRADRPFDRVLELQREAQQRWLLQEQTLQKQLDATRERLSALQSQKDPSQRYILSAEQEQEIARFKQEQLRTQQELKQVRKNLRRGIDQLGAAVKAVNILAMPLVICLAGLGFAWQRRRRTRA